MVRLRRSQGRKGHECGSRMVPSGWCQPCRGTLAPMSALSGKSLWDEVGVGLLAGSSVRTCTSKSSAQGAAPESSPLSLKRLLGGSPCPEAACCRPLRSCQASPLPHLCDSSLATLLTCSSSSSWLPTLSECWLQEDGDSACSVHCSVHTSMRRRQRTRSRT